MNSKYFNNAGAGIMSDATLNCIVNHMKLEMKVGAYKAAITQSKDVAEFYSLSSKLFNAKSEQEIAFIDSASRGWNLIMYGLNITKDDVIVTLDSEYGTNLLTIYDIVKRTGCSVRVVKCGPDGSVNINDIENELLKGGTVLAVSHVTAQGSIVNPVVALGKIANKYGAIYIVDGCQAAGQLKIDVQEINCHAYITAGRKWLRGPRGTGILYVRSDSPIRTPQIDLASADLVFDENEQVVDIKIRKDAKQFELWEKNTASLLGLTNAIKECLDYGIDNINSAIVNKANKIRNSIINNPNLVLVGKSNECIGNASFYLRNCDSENSVKNIFDKSEYIISYVCDWDCPIFFPKNGVKYIFRLTPHYYTDNEDVALLCKLIESL